MIRNSLSIDLVEPVVYLRGHPKDKHTPNLLRGIIRIGLVHPVHIESVTIQFIGTAKTLWPEASQHWDKQILVDSVIPIWRLPIYLKKGSHSIPFEILLSNALSESIECGLGTVRYKLRCRVHLKPWSIFGAYLKADCPVVLVRLPSADTPRCITQTHLLDDDQLDIVIDSAHIAPGIPLSLSIRFSRPGFSIDQLIVKLIERQKFHAPSKHTTRILHHEITLDSPDPPAIVDKEEIRAVYAIPDKQTLLVHPSTTNRNIRVRHWIQVSLQLLLPENAKREILLDAPITVLENSIDDYMTLPVYQQIDNAHTNFAQDTTRPALRMPSFWLKRFQQRYLSKHDRAPPKYNMAS
ncbi:hypothetical protein EC973_003756 [Apophysomyces ossiformis]|uniref:Arrestin C-terminal-like domain-containing protein n=1 Tax=Apophysomyces ossiformis TaxID=679940 RepID=A0A8H7BM38_9FUNG|nr:hypothetical protein EC973_003756 [Apophysomyces ossiformis]